MKKSYLEILDASTKDITGASPLKTLIELNREKKERRDREEILKYIRPPIIKKGTLIMGVKCKDGVVIGSDRKMLRGGETEYTNKIFEFDIGGKILFAAEGLTGIRDDFFLLLKSEISRRRGVDTLYEVKILVEDIISNLTDRYSDRIRDPSPIGVLMGGLENVSNGDAILYYIHSQGYGEQVTFRCSGHGGNYAYSIAKFLCGPHLVSNLSTKDAGTRIAFIISWIAEHVDTTVGGDPDVFIINDKINKVEQLSKEDINTEIKHASEIQKKFDGLIFPRK